MRNKKIINHAGLQAVFYEASHQTSSTRTVVLLHGYGANMHDLAPLAEYMDPHAAHNWYAINGIVDLGMGAPYFDARAWFNLDVEQLMTMASRGQFDGIFDHYRPGFDEAAHAVGRFLSELNTDNLMLAGFSQGSMVAMHTWLSMDLPLKALFLWSSSLTNRLIWRERIAAKKQSNTTILISHGHEDAVLPFHFGKSLNDFLSANSIPTKFIEFDGGHEIPEHVLAASKTIIDDNKVRVQS